MWLVDVVCRGVEERLRVLLTPWRTVQRGATWPQLSMGWQTWQTENWQVRPVWGLTSWHRGHVTCGTAAVEQLEKRVETQLWPEWIRTVSAAAQESRNFYKITQIITSTQLITLKASSAVTIKGPILPLCSCRSWSLQKSWIGRCVSTLVVRITECMMMVIPTQLFALWKEVNIWFALVKLSDTDMTRVLSLQGLVYISNVQDVLH